MGLVRFYLALAVAAFHASILLHQQIKLPWDKKLILGMDGWHAVIFFYIASGFLISYVLEHKYPFTLSGTAAFYQARFLRLFPLWWATCAFSVVVWGTGGLLTNGSVLTIISVGVLFGLDWLVAFRDFPNLDFSFFLPYTSMGWTLGAEITFYAIAPFLLRAPRAALLALAASVSWRFIIWATVEDFTPQLRWNFFFFPSALFFFLVGHFAREVYRLTPALYRFGLWLLLPAAVCVYHMPLFQFDSIYLYAAGLLFALALPSLFEATKDRVILNFFGDLTYPLYLTHVFCIVGIAVFLKTPTGLAFLDQIRQISDPTAQAYAWMLPLLAVCTFAAIFVRYAAEIPFTTVIHLVLTRLTRWGRVEIRPASSEALISAKEAKQDVGPSL